MNQEQRRFLISKVEQTYKSQVEELKDQIPQEPTINNHVVGVFLDKSVQILDSKVIKENLIKLVKRMDKDDELVTQTIDDGYYRRGMGKKIWKDQQFQISIPPEAIMVLPKSYVEEKEEWDKISKDVGDKITALGNQKDLLILKINIGSNQILDKLINQVDSLGDLDLFSNKLSLLASDVEKSGKLLEDKK